MKQHAESNDGRVRWFGQKSGGRGECAGEEEYVSLFEGEREGLQRLALLLTANSETARRCLICALRECIAGSSVSRKWVRSWTRRVVIRNAISLVMGARGESFVNVVDGTDNWLTAFSTDDGLRAIATFKSILDLPELERFVFIICILERYSIHDCALLLGKSPREINEVRNRLGEQVRQVDEFTNLPYVSRCISSSGEPE